MQDRYARNIDYMRISITDRCNLRCKYCMPEGIEWVPMSEILSLEEICQIASAAATLGIRHIKVTGGEPLVRKGCCDLIHMLKDIAGIEKVTLTTNGILLGQYLDELVSAGLDAVNISLDTLDREQYKQITGTDGLDKVIEVIRQASKLPLSVKVNAVSLESTNWRSLVELARDYPIDVRFIEMMPIGKATEYEKNYPPLSNEKLYNMISKSYPDIRKDESTHGFGPAVYYKIEGFQGSIGFISAIHGKFCDNCNRVRLTSQGYLKTCLCYEDGVDLRKILRSDLDDIEKKEKLSSAMAGAILDKPAAHCFDRPEQISETKNMSDIGG
jgi:cyclic pyranopterin phosphate synthase